MLKREVKTKGKTGENEARLEEEFPSGRLFFGAGGWPSSASTELMFSWLRLTRSISGVTGVGVAFPKPSLYPTYRSQSNAESRTDRVNTAMLLGLERTPSVRKEKKSEKNSIKKLIGKKKSLLSTVILRNYFLSLKEKIRGLNKTRQTQVIKKKKKSALSYPLHFFQTIPS